jgi:hypothetical protein
MILKNILLHIKVYKSSYSTISSEQADLVEMKDVKDIIELFQKCFSTLL